MLRLLERSREERVGVPSLRRPRTNEPVVLAGVGVGTVEQGDRLGVGTANLAVAQWFHLLDENLGGVGLGLEQT